MNTNTNFEIGQTVMTIHGKGVIVDKELANDAYPNQEPRMIATGRRGVKLDDGHTWACKDKIAYYYPQELKAI